MKTSSKIFMFTIINLIATIIFIRHLPENVIFGLTGNFFASEFIGRWYNLMIPIAQVISTGIIWLVDVFRPNVPHKYRYLTAWVAVAFTTYLVWVLMFLQLNNFELGVALKWPWTIVILFPIALFLLAEGLYEYNKDMSEKSIFGFRAVRENPIVWKKTHRVAGVTTFIVAITLIVLAVLNELLWHVWWIYLVALGVWLVVYYLFTLLCAYSISKNY